MSRFLTRDEIKAYLDGTTMDLDETDLCDSHEALRDALAWIARALAGALKRERELLARVEELERERDFAVSSAKGAQMAAKAAEKQAEELDRERVECENAKLFLAERFDEAEARVRELREAIQEYLAYPTLAGRRQRLDAALSAVPPEPAAEEKP